MGWIFKLFGIFTSVVNSKLSSFDSVFDILLTFLCRHKGRLEGGQKEDITLLYHVEIPLDSKYDI